MSRNLLKCQIYVTKTAIYAIKCKIYMTFDYLEDGMELEFQLYKDNEWRDAGYLKFNDSYDITDVIYHQPFVRKYFGEDGLSIRHPVINFEQKDSDEIAAIVNDWLPRGKNLSYWENKLNIKNLNYKEKRFVLLKEVIADPIGNVRIKSAVKTPVEKYFDIKMVNERNPDFLEYASQYGVALGGATGVSGESPKFLLTRVDDKIYFGERDIGQKYLVKYPRNNTEIDRNILKAEYCYYQELAYLGFETIDTKNMIFENNALWLPRFDRGEKGEYYHVESLYSILGRAGGELEHKTVIDELFELFKTQEFIKTPEYKSFVIEWIKRDFINIAFGNSDNHGRNISFMVKDGRVALAPIYDFAPMRADPDLIVRTIRWNKEFEYGTDYDFVGIANQFDFTDEILNELKALAQNLKGLKQRLANRGCPNEILNCPALGLDYLDEKMEKWLCPKQENTHMLTI